MRMAWVLATTFVAGAALGAGAIALLDRGGTEVRGPALPPSPGGPEEQPSTIAAPPPALLPSDPSSVISSPGAAPPSRAEDDLVPPEQGNREALALLQGIAVGDGCPVPAELLERIREHRVPPGTRISPDAYRVLAPSLGLEANVLVPLLDDGAIARLLRDFAAEVAAGEPEWRLLKPFHVRDLAAGMAPRAEVAEPLAAARGGAADPRGRRAAAALSARTDSGTMRRHALAQEPDPRGREAALRRIGELAGDGKPLPKELGEAVLAALRDSSAPVRGAAMGILHLLGSRGGEEAVRILRAGTHRECGVEGTTLLVAALRESPEALLAEPISSHLAEDVCSMACSLTGEGNDLLRLLAPRAMLLLGGLPPGVVDPAGSLLDGLAAAGEVGAVREALQAPGLGARVRAAAAAALGRYAAPEEWEGAVVAGLLDRTGDPGVRREFVAARAGGIDREEEGSREEAEAAWARVLRAAAGAEDPGLAAEATRALGALESR